MAGWFNVDIELRDQLIRITMGGFFDPDDVGRMRLALAGAVRTLGCAPNQHITLCDITAMNIQSQEMVATFATIVGQPDIRSRRLAFVTAHSLTRLQARRLTDRPGVAFFSDPDEARAWLLAEDAARA